MSTMALQLPSSFVDVEREEMEYVDGGYYLSHSQCQYIDGMIGTAATMGIAGIAACVDASSAAVAGAIAAAIPGVGTVVAVLGAVYIANQAWNIASALFTDMVHQRGIDIGVGWYFAVPYLSFSPR